MNGSDLSRVRGLTHRQLRRRAAVAFLLGVVAVAALPVWWQLPKWQINGLQIADPKLRAVEDNFRKTITQLLGGLVVLIGARIPYLQLRQQQSDNNSDQRVTCPLATRSRRALNFSATKDNQIHQRLGGIYALEGMMNTSEQYYQPVPEALCAFVRDSSKNKRQPATCASIHG